MHSARTDPPALTDEHARRRTPAPRRQFSVLAALGLLLLLSSCAGGSAIDAKRGEERDQRSPARVAKLQATALIAEYGAPTPNGQPAAPAVPASLPTPTPTAARAPAAPGGEGGELVLAADADMTGQAPSASRQQFARDTLQIHAVVRLSRAAGNEMIAVSISSGAGELTRKEFPASFAGSSWVDVAFPVAELQGDGTYEAKLLVNGALVRAESFTLGDASTGDSPSIDPTETSTEQDAGNYSNGGDDDDSNNTGDSNEVPIVPATENP